MGAGAPGAEVFSGDGEREREGRAREPAGLSVAADQGAGLRRPLCQPGSGGKTCPPFTDGEKEEPQACWTRVHVFTTPLCGQFRLNLQSVFRSCSYSRLFSFAFRF